MKQHYLFTLLMLLYCAIGAQALTVTEKEGWFESAYIKWEPVENADSFNVYYTGEGITDQKIDDQLIRNYGTYYRADIPGLKAGAYTIKVVSILDDIRSDSTTSEAITVKALDRTGFAFNGGRVPGAYNADGTLKANTVVLYITENTKNTVSLDVTGANANPCVGVETILEGYKKGKDNRPLLIRFIGQITDMAYMDKGDIVVENNNNASGYITLEGIGDDAVADGWGIRVKNASNIEIRNIGTMNCDSSEGDNIGLQQNNDYVWIHHCDFFYGGAGSDSDQAKGDGALDCKKSTYVTFSYNHFWDSGKCNLLGLSEGTTDGLFITYHHNWYDHSDSRHPRVRFYSAHVYNNYYDGNSKYGVGSTKGSSVFVENNYFRNCKYPILTSMQGSDVYDEDDRANDYSDMPTFSKEDGGTIKAYNNYIVGQRRFVAYGASGFPSSTIDFDAYVATSRDEQVPGTIVSSYGSNTYNNFDTNSSVMYDYTPESPEDAKTTVMAYAGRLNGGDFKWTFTNSSDDTSYAVDSELKSALTNYKTSLVSIQGDGDASGTGSETGGGDTGGETGGGDTGGEGSVITGDVIHNYTLSGKSSDFFSITGNLSDSKGTVTYGGLTLTQCLKMESSTNITFNIAENAKLLLVLNSSFTGRIKVDGTSYNASAGQLSLDLTSGSHTITKADITNIYYMSIDYPDVTAIDNSTTTEFKMYPNPVQDKLNIVSNTDIAKIEIYSITGTILKTATNTNAIDLSRLPNGTYIVRAYLGSNVLHKMILKN